MEKVTAHKRYPSNKIKPIIKNSQKLGPLTPSEADLLNSQILSDRVSQGEEPSMKSNFIQFQQQMDEKGHSQNSKSDQEEEIIKGNLLERLWVGYRCNGCRRHDSQ